MAFRSSKALYIATFVVLILFLGLRSSRNNFPIHDSIDSQFDKLRDKITKPEIPDNVSDTPPPPPPPPQERLYSVEEEVANATLGVSEI